MNHSDNFQTLSPNRPEAIRPLLVLDLDETLIYACEDRLDLAPDFHVPPYHVYFRPGLQGFLHGLSLTYDLAVWTSSSPDYARVLSGLIFADAPALKFVWARDRCTPERDFLRDTWTMAKRLSKLKKIGFDLAKVVMVDDSPEKHTRNYGNLVAVAPFFGDPTDQELVNLAPYLVKLSAASDIRRVEKRGWARQVHSSAG